MTDRQLFPDVTDEDVATLDRGEPPPRGHPENRDDDGGDDDDQGEGGVREPRRPAGPAPTTAAEAAAPSE